ncbi:MAG: hypothetical protein QMD04_06925 [Anaerolineales bacterium]|nr:hypothetical protein [Anaerolineales bacterium]
MTTELTITTERIDDFPLLLAVMLHLGLPDIFDHHLGRHGLHQGLSWGWIATIWLAHILTESNHRKQPVQAWVRQAKETIEKITGQHVRELDFTDDRLTLLLRRLSKPGTWHAIEKELGQSIIRVYELKPKQVRLDPTTVSGYHDGGAQGVKDAISLVVSQGKSPTWEAIRTILIEVGLQGTVDYAEDILAHAQQGGN